MTFCESYPRGITAPTLYGEYSKRTKKRARATRTSLRHVCFYVEIVSGLSIDSRCSICTRESRIDVVQFQSLRDFQSVDRGQTTGTDPTRRCRLINFRIKKTNERACSLIVSSRSTKSTTTKRKQFTRERKIIS